MRSSRALPVVTTLTALVSNAAAAGDRGPPELPGLPLRVPFPWLAAGFVAAGVALVALLVLCLARRLPKEPAGPPAEPAGPSPEDRALGRLTALRERPCADGPAADAFHDELAAVLRAFVAEAHDIPGSQTTTEEFAAGLREVVPATDVSALVAILRRCDLARFARIGSSAEGRSALLHDAEALVRATRMSQVTR